MRLPKEGHRMRRKLHDIARTTSGEGYNLEADDCARPYRMHVSDNSFPVGGDDRANHPTSLTLAPQYYAVA